MRYSTEFLKKGQRIGVEKRQNFGKSVSSVCLAAVVIIFIAGAASRLIAQPETLYPWVYDYSQTLTMKLGLLGCSDTIGTPKGVDKALTEVINRDNLTRGIPKILYLVGWQAYGHDGSYPDLSATNPNLKRPQDARAADALAWLIRQAAMHNTTVSYHINMRDAYKESPLFQLYADKGCIESTGGVWCNRQSYIVDNGREYDKGLAQNRIDACVNENPALSTVAKTIHPDVFHMGDFEGRKKIAIYWREKWGMDVTSECPTLPGFVGFGWHMNSWGYSVGDQFTVPSYICCGGDQGDPQLGVSINAEYWGADEGTFLKEFSLSTLPWYYLNRLIRISRSGTTVTFSNNVISTPTTIKRNGEFIRDGNDLFVPALWRKNREIISYSESGFSNRSWAMPPEWNDVSSVDIYSITTSGIQSGQKNVRVTSGRLTLSVAAGKAVSILPAGDDPNLQPIVQPSGTVSFLALNPSLGGSWQGAIGSQGYSVIGASSSIPAGTTLAYIGGTNTTWSASTAEARALQNPGNPSTRIAAAKTTVNHMVVDIDVGQTPREVALYFLDWGKNGCRMAVDVMDLNNFKRLDTRIISSCQDGKYLQYRISGRMWFRVTRLPGPANSWTGPNAVLSGVFFDPKRTSQK
jgi:hypothetical protein